MPVLHEGVCSGDPEMVQLILQYRDFQRFNKRTVGIPELLQKLNEVLIMYFYFVVVVVVVVVMVVVAAMVVAVLLVCCNTIAVVVVGWQQSYTSRGCWFYFII